MSNAASALCPTASQHGHCFTADRRWSASMELRFAVRQERTILETMRFNGPLRVQRPFYPEAAPQDAPGRQQPSQPCHCCLLHPPGGLVSGDDLHLAVGLEHGAHVLLTAPSASKFYAADACNVRQRQSTEVRAAFMATPTCRTSCFAHRPLGLKVLRGGFLQRAAAAEHGNTRGRRRAGMAAARNHYL